jgi:hypothetical protein
MAGRVGLLLGLAGASIGGLEEKRVINNQKPEEEEMPGK